MRGFLALLLTVGVVLANGPPPVAPKGKKFVGVKSEVLLSKDVTGYVFFSGERFAPGGVATIQKVELNDKKSAPIGTAGFRKAVWLYAVPESAVKDYRTEKDLIDALEMNKVKGMQTLGLGSGGVTVSDSVKGDIVAWTYTITNIDEKDDKRDGIKVEIKGEGYEKPAEKQDEKKPLALAEPGYLVGSLAAALSITFGGLWLEPVMHSRAVVGVV